MRFRHTRDERDHQLCRQLVAGVKRPASRRGNLMFYEGGAAPWRNGRWLKGCRDHETGFLDHLVRWVGNDIEEVSPRGKFLPIFAGSRRPLPPFGAEGSR